MRRIGFRAVAGAVVLLAATFHGSVAQAQLEGKMIGLQYLYPSVGTTGIDFGSRVVGDEVEYVVTNVFSVDANDHSLVFSNLSGLSGTFPSTSFAGARIFDAGGTISPFTVVTVGEGTNVIGFTQSRITFNSDNIYLNLSGLAVGPESKLIINMASSESTVPEPSTLALLGTGLVGLVPLIRRKQKPN